MIREDAWIPRVCKFKVNELVNNSNVHVVADLINPYARDWDTILVWATFSKNLATKILQIPLATVADADVQVW